MRNSVIGCLFLCFNVYSLSGQSTDYNTIDAVTSASGKLNLIGGEAYPTFAVIRWEDAYNNGTEHLIKYGTTPSFDAQINLKPFAANTVVIDTLPDLIPSTKYYGQFYRTYRGQSYTTDFSFTTAASVAVSHFTAVAQLPLTGSHRWVVYNAAGRAIRRIQPGNTFTTDKATFDGMPLNLGTGIFIIRYAEPYYPKTATIQLRAIQ